MSLTGKKLGVIAFVMDERLSREKAALLTRNIHALRQFAQVDLISGGISEEDLLKKLPTQNYSLVLAPWYRYLAWSRIEAFYGLTRTSGPTFAGYFCEPTLPYEIGDQADHLRTILLDFDSLSVKEVQILVSSLIQDFRRSGIRPLLEPNTPIYCENWYGFQGLGSRMDALSAIPEIANTDWSKRFSSIRICMSALWSLIYEEGPGKSEFNQTLSATTAKAYFQASADKNVLTLRLCYSMASWGPKDALGFFWPDPKHPTAPVQLLLKYSDFVRVHSIVGTQDLEIVAGFVNSAPVDRSHKSIRTLWVEPLAVNLVTEIPFEAPGPQAPHLKPFPVVVPATQKPRPAEEHLGLSKDRFVFEAAVKIRKLKQLLEEREELIRELKAGGVGTALPLPPPDAEALLDAFQERYFEAKFQIRQMEIAIANLETRGATPSEVEAIRLKMTTLTSREESWIRKVATTLEQFRVGKKAQGGE